MKRTDGTLSPTAARQEQYGRTQRLLGAQALKVLRGAHVAVFGLGGVGGHAAEVLARSGVGELSLFDNDTVSLSNLNRQLVALHSTLGQYKVDAMAARIHDIDSDILVHPNRLFYSADTADSVLLSDYDYVLDCIDTVSAKLLLIERCKAADVPILCSMGAANKLDPTAFHISDISRTSVCPLAKVIRIACRKRHLGKVKVVWSDEPALTPLPQDEEAIAETSCSACPGGTQAAEAEPPQMPNAADVPEFPHQARRSVPASNAFVPAACGLIVGGEAVKDLLRAAGCLRKA